MTCRHVDAPATPTMLRLAPQLAVLAVLDEALSSAISALIAQHPELAAMINEERVADPSEAWRLYDSLAHCSHLLADYRLAVATVIADLDALSTPPHEADIPF